jgi:O-antigen ligase
MRTSKYFSDQTILFLAVCVVLSFLCQIFNFLAPVNIIYIITLLLVLFCYLISGYATRIIVLMVWLLFFSSFIHGFRYNDMDYYTHLLITLCIFICIEVSADVKISLRTFKKIASLFLVSSIILLIAFYLGPLKKTYFNYNINSVSLNFDNPNAAGLWVTCLFIMVMYSAFLFKSFKKVLYIIVALAMLPIVLATQSRNSFLACIFFLSGLVMVKVFKIKKAPHWVLFILTILPLIVFVFYMFVIVSNMGFWNQLFSMDAIDKGLGTREDIWQIVIDDFGHCFLFGDYYQYYNEQMHNSLATLFCRFGAPVTLLACIAMYRTLVKLQDNSSFYASLSLSAIFFTGCFEASVFVGIAGMYLMLLLIPACASVENTNEANPHYPSKRNRHLI